MKRLVMAAAVMGTLLVLGYGFLPTVEVSTADHFATGWWSLVPPVIAIGLAIAMRQIIAPLCLSVLVGALIGVHGDVMAGVLALFRRYLWPVLTDVTHLSILLFTASLLGLVRVATVSGGIQGVINKILTRASDPQRVQVATAWMGIAVFFDDYANTAVIGCTMRSVFDRFKLSREKLAYLIDSTAAPVAGIAIISTWIGMEVSTMQNAVRGLTDANGYSLVFQALPYRFYCFAALGMVFALVYSNRDFGPMLTAERAARMDACVRVDHHLALGGGDSLPIWNQKRTARMGDALWPIAFVINTIFFAVLLGGTHAIPPEQRRFPRFILDSFVESSNLMDGHYLFYVFAVAALMGSVIAIVLPWLTGGLHLGEGLKEWMKGVQGIVPTLIVLVLAWTLSWVCRDVGTADYLVAISKPFLRAHWVPAVVFILAGLIAFSTGTSWGTMAILMPVAASLGYHAGGMAVMLPSMAAVLDGAIFGDHCSPISDTTILSSACSGCDHLEHVRTQMPYALAGATAAGTGGYVLVNALGYPLWTGYLVIAVLIGVIVMGLGKVPNKT